MYLKINTELKQETIRKNKTNPWVCICRTRHCRDTTSGCTVPPRACCSCNAGQPDHDRDDHDHDHGDDHYYGDDDGDVADDNHDDHDHGVTTKDPP